MMLFHMQRLQWEDDMNDEYIRIWKDAATCLKSLSWHLPGDTEENHDRPQAIQPTLNGYLLDVSLQ